MHLCVSSKYHETYVMACNMVESLLTNLYKEYEVYSRKVFKRQISLGIKKIDSGAGSSSQYKMSNYELKSPDTNKENSLTKPKRLFYSPFSPKGFAEFNIDLAADQRQHDPVEKLCFANNFLCLYLEI